MPEWSNGPVSKSGVCHRTEGSNPSLSLKQKAKPQGFAFCFSRNKPMRTLAEGSIDRARAKRTQRGQGLRRSRNPEGNWRKEVSKLSHPSLVLREGRVAELSHPSLKEAARLRFLFQQNERDETPRRGFD